MSNISYGDLNLQIQNYKETKNYGYMRPSSHFS